MSKPIKVLAVDDEKDVLFIVTTALKNEGFEVTTASNGVECLKKVEEEDFDAIVLDVMMPQMDGFETLDNLNKDPRTAKIPVIMLTGLSEKSKKRDAIDAGTLYYIVKPFEILDLVSKIRLAIEESPQL